MSENLLEVRDSYWVQGERNENWPLSKHSIAYAASLVVKTGPGKLYGIAGYNSGAAQFILILDAAAVPANGVVPCLPITVPATSNFSVFYGDIGRSFDTGIVVCNSSTAPTLTIGAADCFFDAQYL